ncbi:MAG: DUF72 domain-containing protein [Leptolyngbyaceae cyanobacterium MO_188.B28]|nr:DUF72 domain-containing protein [Leptolyngbyaceae cyanobacterium MO_188.B28]
MNSPVTDKGQVFIGTSGFSYSHWGKGVFYPKQLKSVDWLNYYSGSFNTVELNNTFYRLPSEETLKHWYEATPPDFIFAVKGNRFITHLKRLKHAEEDIRSFLARISSLKQKLGPVLFQLPPSLPLSLERLEDFLNILRSQSIVPVLRTALEVRHSSWLVPEVFEQLKDANVAICWMDWPELLVQGPVTADFIYIRRHGPTSRYSSFYSPERLQVDAARIAYLLQAGHDVYLYFNNDACSYAVKNAQQLKRLIS